MSVLRRIGPGLVTGAADDDPSGIATYSQIGAQFGYTLAWTMLFSLPFMIVIQDISARIGCVTGRGIAENIRRHYSPWLVRGVVLLLLVANIINLGADLGAMGEALRLIVGGNGRLYTIGFGIACVLAETFISYARYSSALKWLTLSLLSYVGVVFTAHVPWNQALFATLVPHFTFDAEHAMALVAVLGTTISPYLFFWQCAMEVQDQQRHGDQPLVTAPAAAPNQLRRIRTDTITGMSASNLVAIFIILATAATLHTAGITDIQTSSQAAEALRPIAGVFTFAIFSIGIIGTGLLAVPVLAGSGAYALAEAFAWREGLDRKLMHARSFYAAIAVSTLVGIALNFVGLNPVKALYWSAVLNGLLAAPVMAIIMLAASNPKIMGDLVLSRTMQVGGWLATLVMVVAGASFLVLS